LELLLEDEFEEEFELELELEFELELDELLELLLDELFEFELLFELDELFELEFEELFELLFELELPRWSCLPRFAFFDLNFTSTRFSAWAVVPVSQPSRPLPLVSPASAAGTRAVAARTAAVRIVLNICISPRGVEEASLSSPEQRTWQPSIPHRFL
jgi:hypothetical protein